MRVAVHSKYKNRIPESISWTPHDPCTMSDIEEDKHGSSSPDIEKDGIDQGEGHLTQLKTD